MKYRIEKERLVLTCTPDEQADLELMRSENEDRFGTDDFMYDLLEALVTNDSFSWTDSRWTGDLTTAPMLALLGDEEIGPHEDCSGLYPCGRWDGETRVQPILYRWAFMDYAVTSPQEELLRTGEAVWDGGRFVERDGQMDLCYTEREFGVRNFPLV
jgi:hypothetical protein